MVSPVIAASEPPVTMASAMPCRIMLVRLADGVGRRGAGRHGAKFGPLSPYRMETRPAAMSGMNIGTKNGDTRSGPFVR